jgi:cysteine desulfurase
MDVYLDNNATTRLDPAVLTAMMPFLTEVYGNPSSAHGRGTDARQAVEAARERVARLIGAASPSEIVFTSGGTESGNTAILAALRAAPERRAVVTSAVEHPAVRTLLDHLEAGEGYEIRRIGVDEHGRLDRVAYRAALGPDVALVSIMRANNETGTLFPVAELADEAAAAGAAFHTDAVQAAGRVPLHLAGTAIDFLSLSGHKLHGPKGIGALYVRRGARFSPFVRGGRQERGRRAGTENVPGIVGLGAAAGLALARLDADACAIAALRDRLEAGALATVPGCRVAGDPEARLPNTTMLVFEGVEGEAVAHRLDRAGIAVSQGSACSAGGMEPSPVLAAMGFPPALAAGAVRFSLSRETTADEIGRTLAVLPDIVSALRVPAPRRAAGTAFRLAG